MRYLTLELRGFPSENEWYLSLVSSEGVFGDDMSLSLSDMWSQNQAAIFWPLVRNSRTAAATTTRTTTATTTIITKYWERIAAKVSFIAFHPEKKEEKQASAQPVVSNYLITQSTHRGRRYGRYFSRLIIKFIPVMSRCAIYRYLWLSKWPADKVTKNSRTTYLEYRKWDAWVPRDIYVLSTRLLIGWYFYRRN